MFPGPDRRFGAFGIRRFGVRGASPAGAPGPLVLHNEADAENVTVNGGLVTGMRSLVRGHTMSNQDAMTQPSWNLEQVNGYTTMTFGAADFLQGVARSAFALSGSYLYEMVIKRPAAASVNSLRTFGTDASGDGFRVRVQADEYPVHNWGDDSQLYTVWSVAPIPDDVWAIMAIGYDVVGARSFCKVNNSIVWADSPKTVHPVFSTVAHQLNGDSSGAGGSAFVFRQERLWDYGAAEMSNALITELITPTATKYGITI